MVGHLPSLYRGLGFDPYNPQNKNKLKDFISKYKFVTSEKMEKLSYLGACIPIGQNSASSGSSCHKHRVCKLTLPVDL